MITLNYWVSNYLQQKFHCDVEKNTTKVKKLEGQIGELANTTMCVTGDTMEIYLRMAQIDARERIYYAL